MNLSDHIQRIRTPPSTFVGIKAAQQVEIARSKQARAVQLKDKHYSSESNPWNK